MVYHACLGFLWAISFYWRWEFCYSEQLRILFNLIFVVNCWNNIFVYIGPFSKLIPKHLNGISIYFSSTLYSWIVKNSLSLRKFSKSKHNILRSTSKTRKTHSPIMAVKYRINSVFVFNLFPRLRCQVSISKLKAFPADFELFSLNDKEFKWLEDTFTFSEFQLKSCIPQKKTASFRQGRLSNIHACLHCSWSLSPSTTPQGKKEDKIWTGINTFCKGCLTNQNNVLIQLKKLFHEDWVVF